MSGAMWLAADWGSSRLRLWALDGEDRVLGRETSDQGMSRLAPDAFEPALRALAAPWLASRPASRPERPVPALICGMAGAREGWREAPYRAVPCPPPAGEALVRAGDGAVFDARIIPGLSQAEPADVMRGEETQLAGALALRPGFEGAVCLPGTHSKWARLRAGRVERFRTFLTGELFALLGAHSVLRHSLAGEDWEEAAFAEGAAEALADPAAAPGRLFQIRARALLTGEGAGALRARLSGLLIGAEIAAAGGFWREGPVLLIAEERIGALYRTALSIAGAPAPERLGGEETALAGLIAIARRSGLLEERSPR